MKIKHLIPPAGPMRLPFLVLPPACVFLGLGTAIWEKGQANVFYFLLTLVGALAAHISVNAFNEYFDFKSGLDAKTSRTPFSGGSGTLPEQPELARAALYTASAALGITMLIGVFFVLVRGWGLLPVGVLEILTILSYTIWLAYNPILCLIAPGLGFGTLMVLGTHFVLTGSYSWTAFFASLVPFFLVSDLLLLNQFPDVEADKSIGRKHYPIIAGIKTSSYLYGAFLAGAYLSIIVGVVVDRLPAASLIGLGTLFLAVPAAVGAVRYGSNVPKLIPFMGLNVLINILTPVLVAIGLLIA